MSSRTAPDANASRQPVNLTKRDKLRKFIKNAAKAPKELVKAGSKKVAKAAIEWMTEVPLRPREGEHPPWPGPTGVGKKLDFKLKPQAYKGQTLIENTVASFYPMRDDRNLMPRQISARREIRLRYRAYRLKNDFGPDDIKPFVRLFDQFFFCGSMTRRSGPRICTFLWETDDALLSSYANWFTRPDMPWGFTRDRWVRGYGPFSEIHLAGESFYAGRAPLRFFLETLVHEMAHAYLNLHVCRCAACLGNTLNTCGATGHGPSFLMLLDCIDQTMKSWDEGLRGMAAERLTTSNGKVYIYDEVHSLLHSETKYFNEKMRILYGERPPRVQKPCPASDVTCPTQAENTAATGEEPCLPQTGGACLSANEAYPQHVKKTRRSKNKKMRDPMLTVTGPSIDGPSPLTEELSRATEAISPQGDPNPNPNPTLALSHTAEEQGPCLISACPPKIIGTPTLLLNIRLDEKERKRIAERRNKIEQAHRNRDRDNNNKTGRRGDKEKWIKTSKGWTIALKLNERRDLTQREPDMGVYMIASRVGGTVVEMETLDAAGNAVQGLLNAPKERGWGWLWGRRRGRPYR
ncbi:hypothetical protein F5B17DRAFT_452119 [Nemania serpens]|nr:hypothetical protein F5B17DRAFT_452119 [Nemania serpens]